MARRILMLHGYSQSGSIFSKRMGAIRKSCGKNVEFVFLDAPHILHPVDLVGPGSLEALGASEASEQDPALTPRGWWRTNAERTEARGLEESIATIKDVLKENTFDGIFGFSQGAAMAAFMSALLERPHVFPPFLIDGKPPHPPLQFCVSISGFKCPGPIASSAFGASFDTPTLHVIGKTDVVVIEERSKRLLEISNQARLEEHDGGHFVPSKLNWRNFFRDFLTAEDPFEIPSPGRPVLSAPSL